MRQLSPTFLQTLKTGFLAPLVQRVCADPDLDLEIRDNYLNIYYKGNSLLRLDEATPPRYRVKIDTKFLAGQPLLDLVDPQTVSCFLAAIPRLKENIQIHGKSTVETEYEQLVIRANNYQPRNNSEYFVIDRQYAGPAGRFDLTGLFWPRKGRQKNRMAYPCLIEIKYALNPDIQEVHAQLSRYYAAIQNNLESFVLEAETVFKQKLELGLFNLPANRLAAMKDLRLSRELRDFQFILLLIDYNPHSSAFDPARLAALPFADQVRVFQTGFALWESNLKPAQPEPPVFPG